VAVLAASGTEWLLSTHPHSSKENRIYHWQWENNLSGKNINAGSTKPASIIRVRKYLPVRENRGIESLLFYGFG
jgi:hypothetical protein